VSYLGLGSGTVGPARVPGDTVDFSCEQSTCPDAKRASSIGEIATVEFFTDDRTLPPTEDPPATAGKDRGERGHLVDVSVPGYAIINVIGHGGMGVVYQARHLGLDRVVALKMVLAGVHASPEQRARFSNESRAVAQLQHPRIVQI
jgi:serine/threonine protein kinase